MQAWYHAGYVKLADELEDRTNQFVWRDGRGPGGASRDRTDDPLLAKQVLSQLSYGPFSQIPRMVGLGRFELPASPLSGVRSDQLSYRPGFETLTGKTRDAGDQSSFTSIECR